MRPEVEAMPWGTMRLDGVPIELVVAARRAWTSAAFQEHRTGIACAATLRALTARWNALRQERALEIALEWLADLGIEPVYELPAPHVPEPPPQPRGPVIDLLDLLVLGAPGGKSEIIDGRAVRVARVDPSQARPAFTQLARQICEYHGVAWRKRFAQGKSTFTMERMHLRLEIDARPDDRFG